MKKLLIGMAALSIGAAAHADVKFGGDTSINYTNTKNKAGVKDSNEEGFVLWNNIMVDGNKGEKLSYHLQLKHVADMGSRVGVNPSANNSNAAGSAYNSTQGNDLVFVQEAVGFAKIGENSSISFGRSGLDLNGGELISKRSFDDSGVAFDGIRFVHDADWGRLGVSYSVSGKSAATGSNRIKFRGLSYTMKNTPEAISNLEFHYINAQADGALATAVSKPNSRTWIGLNVAGEMGAVDYRFDMENYKGTTNPSTDAKATMMDLEIGYRMPNFKDSRVYLGYHNDGTTDDGVYDALYYDNHKFGGLMDVMSWGNLNDISLGYTMKMDADCDFGIAYHTFSRIKDTKAIGSFGTSGTNTAAGSEIDLWTKHNYASGLYVYAELGSFTAGDYLKDNSAGENITRMYVETGFAF